jgi:MFS transporter, ACS family, D-galactonate transporter
MSATATDPIATQSWSSTLLRRQLDTYPSTGPRYTYLAITVLATITLYYESYVGGSVSTILLPALHMTFTFYLYALAVGNVIGAFGALFAGLSDRIGRTNLVVFGLFFTGLFTAFIIPEATSKWPFVIETFVVGVVEGICLVATPALIRDFSPQNSRASAMGFWTTGPVVGSLIVAIVGTNTIPAVIPSVTFWTHEFRIAGIVGLIVFVVAFLGLRELSPNLRDQLMVTMRDRVLIQAKAKGIDVQAALRHPWRQMIKADVVISSVAVGVMLLIYYTLVGFGVIYLSVIFGETTKNANGLFDWAWGANVVALILVGYLSDKFKVRKPFMVIGALLSAAAVIVFLLQIGHHPGYYALALIMAGIEFFLGVAYAPWLASFTETLEARNPALIATGLAVYGWVLRVIVFATFLIAPAIISSASPLVSYGGQVSIYATQYKSQLAFATTHANIVATAQKIPPAVIATATTDATQLANAQKFAPELTVIQANPALFTKLAAFPPGKIPPALQAQAVAAAGGGAAGVQVLTTIAANQAAITGVIAVAPALQTVAPYATDLQTIAPFSAQLTALSKVPPAALAYLKAHGAAVAAASKQAPGQWKTWYWICVGGLLFFAACVPLLKGRWKTSDAKRDQQAHEDLVTAELAKMTSTTTSS